VVGVVEEPLYNKLHGRVLPGTAKKRQNVGLSEAGSKRLSFDRNANCGDLWSLCFLLRVCAYLVADRLGGFMDASMSIGARHGGGVQNFE